MDLLAGLAFSIKTNRLDLDDVVRLLLQVPKNTRAAGGVDFPNESLHVPFLSLAIERGIETSTMDWSFSTVGKKLIFMNLILTGQ